MKTGAVHVHSMPPMSGSASSSNHCCSDMSVQDVVSIAHGPHCRFLKTVMRFPRVRNHLQGLVPGYPRILHCGGMIAAGAQLELLWGLAQYCTPYSVQWHGAGLVHSKDPQSQHMLPFLPLKAVQMRSPPELQVLPHWSARASARCCCCTAECNEARQVNLRRNAPVGPCGK